MLIAAFRRHLWPEAIRTAGHECIELPAPPNCAYFESTLEDRIEHGRRLREMLRGRPIDLIVDAHGDGMLFVDDPRRAGMDALLHHVLDVPLVSHWTESLRILFKRMNLALVLDALQSPTWHKGVFTTAHVAEMSWMGIPNCFYLPLAADDIPYPHSPADGADGPKVFFAGSQQSRYFSHSDGVDVRTQWPGAMALAAVTDGSVPTFLDAYRRYELGPSPSAGDPPQCRAEAVREYFAHKMFFVAARNLTTRDRFVCLLQKKLGGDFLLIGDERWRDAYGLEPAPPVDEATYRHLIRQTPICMNMVNGDNDTGLNLRPFEITAWGGFLLNYNQPELDGFFEIGRECEAFRSETELLKKIHFYLEHPEERDAIAEAGRRRTLNGHLLHHRLETMISYLKGLGRL